METEIWKAVKDYEGLYEVSNLGRVKSINFNHTKRDGFLNPISTKRGYSDVSLCKNGVIKSFKIHSIVAFAFLDYPINSHERYVVDHINGNKIDNRIDNLRFVTTRFNSSIGFRKDSDRYTSKCIGVSKSRFHSRCMASITINYKSINLGYFEKEEDAGLAYQNALLKSNQFSLYMKNIGQKYPNKNASIEFINFISQFKKRTIKELL